MAKRKPPAAASENGHSKREQLLPRPDPESIVKAHRRCPRCWPGRRGFGVAYSSGPRTTYYRCRRHVDAEGNKQGGGCGYTWKIRWRWYVDGIEDRRAE